METSVAIALILVVIIIAYYFMPLVIHRIKTKKVRVTVEDTCGTKKTMDLYLYPDDPLWEVIKTHKGIKNV